MVCSAGNGEFWVHPGWVAKKQLQLICWCGYTDIFANWACFFREIDGSPCGDYEFSPIDQPVLSLVMVLTFFKGLAESVAVQEKVEAFKAAGWVGHLGTEGKSLKNQQRLRLLLHHRKFRPSCGFQTTTLVAPNFSDKFTWGINPLSQYCKPWFVASHLVGFTCSNHVSINQSIYSFSLS